MTLAPQEQAMRTTETRIISVSFVGKLDSGELLASVITPTADPATVTISNEAVNTAALTILGKAVAIGQAVQFKVTSATASTTITVTATSDSTPAQTLVATLTLNVT